MDLVVCDAMMGEGKTLAAIAQMNRDVDQKYLFVTPYLDEVKRVLGDCKSRGFVEPTPAFCGHKIGHLRHLLSQGINVVCTHELLSLCGESIIEYAKQYNYIMILDEVFDVVDQYEIAPRDIKMAQDTKAFNVMMDGRMEWSDKKYNGKLLLDLRTQMEVGDLYNEGNTYIFNLFSPRVFEAFKRVVILTYMFDASPQKWYFDLYGVKYRNIYPVQLRDGSYSFSDSIKPKKALRGNIHIVDDKALNKVGDDRYALSYSKFRQIGKGEYPEWAVELKKNICNFIRYRSGAKSEDCLWTVFKRAKNYFKGNGYTKAFLACNARGTNKYRDRRIVVYGINVFLNPIVKNFFVKRGVKVDEDGYALSTMIQFIWRSAIRDGKNISIYIPSRRMRELMIDWLAGFENAGNVEVVEYDDLPVDVSEDVSLGDDVVYTDVREVECV